MDPAGVAGCGSAKYEALPGVAAQGLQLLTLCAGLDAFGDDVQAQSVANPITA